MTTCFSNILIPVDFSINTEIAVQKSLWLAREDNITIQLLHVINATPQVGGLYMHGFPGFFPVTTSSFKTLIASRLEEIKHRILSAAANTEVAIHIAAQEPIQDAIIHFANKLQTDLIIVGKNKNHNWFPFLKTINSNEVSRKTNCAVLTVKPGGISNKIKSIVIPIGRIKPERKIQLLEAVTGNNRPKVHLVSIFKKADPDKWTGVFLDTYRTLSQHLHYPVAYEILTGNNTAKAIYAYARSVRADMLIINTNEESKISPISGMQTNDLIRPNSKLNVLTA
ncbi:hypothetical protein BH10BAC2_BH10BAC2_15080 [soil metagenome]